MLKLPGQDFLVCIHQSSLFLFEIIVGTVPESYG
jgi:hypothetical protein